MSGSVADKLTFENELLAEGYKLIAGMDEVGRGPLCGPVVCAAVIMPLHVLQFDDYFSVVFSHTYYCLLGI